MQNAIVDTTGALYAAGTIKRSPSAGFNGVQTYESPQLSPSGVRPVLVGPGRGWAASEPPFCFSSRSSANGRLHFKDARNPVTLGVVVPEAK
jgi:hypothetical protein